MSPSDRPGSRPGPARWLQRVAPVVLVAGLGLAATIVAGRTVRDIERRELESEFASVANER